MILLDTHAFLWLATDPDRLSRRAAAAIRRALRSDGIAIASVTLWELAQLAARGRLRPRGSLERWLDELTEATSVAVRDITVAVAAGAALLPPDFPGDPIDRLIAATALAEGLVLVTRDERIRDSPLVKTIW